MSTHTTARWISRLGLICGTALVTALSGPTPAPASSTPTPMIAFPLSATDAPAPTQTRLPDGRTLVLGLTASLRGETADDAKVMAGLIARRHHTATVLPDGRVLILGGIDADHRLVKTAQWFDPHTGTFSSATNVSLLARAGHTATLLTDGRLLVTGGWHPELGALQEAELWDYRSNRSELLSHTLVPPRLGHRAALMADGRVVIRGGTDAATHQVAPMSVYDPGRSRFADSDRAQAAPPDATTTPAPAIAGSIPAEGAKGFPVDGVVTVRFATLMDVTTLTAQTVTLLGPEGEAEARVVGAEEGRLVFVTPTQPLLPGSPYTLFLQGVSDDTHRPMPLAALSFTTARVGKTVTPGTAPLTSTTPAPSSEPSPVGTDSNPSSGAAPNGSNAAAPPAHATLSQSPIVQWLSTGATVALSTGPCAAHKGPTTTVTPCRETAIDQEGVWRPGRSNMAGRWTTGRPLPPLAVPPQADSLRLGRHGTAVFGQTLRLDDRPLAGATVSIGDRSTRTAQDGTFLLRDVPAGHQELLVDGASANAGKVQYIRFVVGIDVVAGEVTSVPHHLFVARIEDRDRVAIESPLRVDTVVTHPDIPGLEMHLPAGTVFRDRDGKILTEIALVPSPQDRAPFPLPAPFPVYFLVAPGDARIQGLDPARSHGVRVVYPNLNDTGTPSQPHDFWLYDAAHSGWEVYGTGHITNGNRQVAPDDGVQAFGVMPLGMSYPGYPFMSPVPPPNTPVNRCEATTASDPVDCASGVFLHERVDLSLAGTPALELRRIHVSGDSVSRAFGKGATFTYAGTYLYTSGSAQYYLIQPTGGRTRFSSLDNGAPAVNQTGWLFGAKMFSFANSLKDSGENLILRDGSSIKFLNDQGRPVEFSDRYGNSVTIRYTDTAPYLHFINAIPDISDITASNGRSIRLTYDASHRVIQATDNAGHTVIYDYCPSAGAAGCPSGYLQTVTYPDTTTEKFTYDSASNIATVTDRRGNLMATNVYDANRRVKTQTLADGAYQFAYTTNTSNVVTRTEITNPRGVVRRLDFDANGYPTSIIDALGTSSQRTRTIVRDPVSSLVTSVTSPLGLRTDKTYTGMGQVKTITTLAGTPSAATTSYDYTPRYSELTSVTDPLGHVNGVTFDAEENPTMAYDGLGNQSLVGLDRAGRVTSLTDPNGHTDTWTYSTDLDAITDNPGRTARLSYDGVGRVIAARDPLGHIGQVAYNDTARTVTGKDPQGGTTVATYDPNGNLVSLRDANGGITTYMYDARNRLITRTDPLHVSETWTYDGMGNVKTHTDRKLQTTRYDYTPLDQLQQVIYPDGATRQYTYDADGRTTQVVDSADGTVSFAYDDLQRTVRETTAQGTVDTTYDAAGRPASKTVSGQATVFYTFDAADRLTRVSQGSADVRYTYDAASRLTSVTLPNGMSRTYAYDNADQVTGITYRTGSGTLVGDITYTYDDAGQITARGGTLGGTVMPTATASNATFDAANRMTSFEGGAITYDANGNLMARNGRTYTWDTRNRLVAMTYPGGGATFSYDALGRRQTRTVAGQARSYRYDGLNPVSESIGANNGSILTGLGLDEYYVRNDGNGNRYFLTDLLNSTVALTDSTGALKTTYAYEPYGSSTASGSEASSPNTLQYTGREMDGTGLVYLRNRYYDTELRRFIAEDPIGVAGGLNIYAYVGGNPVSSSDPMGLADCPSTGTLLVADLDEGKLLACNEGKKDLEFNASFSWRNPYFTNGGGCPKCTHQAQNQDFTTPIGEFTLGGSGPSDKYGYKIQYGSSYPGISLGGKPYGRELLIHGPPTGEEWPVDKPIPGSTRGCIQLARDEFVKQIDAWRRNKEHPTNRLRNRGDENSSPLVSKRGIEWRLSEEGINWRAKWDN